MADKGNERAKISCETSNIRDQTLKARNANMWVTECASDEVGCTCGTLFSVHGTGQKSQSTGV